MSSRPLRIGIDGREMGGRPTGVGRYLRSLLRRFASDSRHQFLLYTPAPVDLPVRTDAILERVTGGRASLGWEQRTLPDRASLDRVDVLLSPAYSCPLLTKIPRVTAMHDLSFFARREEFSFVHGVRRRALATASARASRILLACSQFTRSEVGRWLGAAAASKTVVAPLGPDDDLPPGPPRAEARQALALAGDAPCVLTVGTVLRRRNTSTLVRAFAALRRVHPQARLLIVGENRSHPFEDVEGLAREMGLESAVRVTGFVADAEVARAYAAADVAVFLSEYEGFGLPALEAMSRGVPTIVANRGSLDEIAGPGARLVEPVPGAVAEALLAVLGDPVLANALRASGVERARAFSWDAAAAKTLAALEQAAG